MILSNCCWLQRCYFFHSSHHSWITPRFVGCNWEHEFRETSNFSKLNDSASHVRITREQLDVINYIAVDFRREIRAYSTTAMDFVVANALNMYSDSAFMAALSENDRTAMSELRPVRTSVLIAIESWLDLVQFRSHLCVILRRWI